MMLSTFVHNVLLTKINKLELFKLVGERCPINLHKLLLKLRNLHKTPYSVVFVPHLCFQFKSGLGPKFYFSFQF